MDNLMSVLTTDHKILAAVLLYTYGYENPVQVQVGWMGKVADLFNALHLSFKIVEIGNLSTAA